MTKQPENKKELIACAECSFVFECSPDDPSDLCECPECLKKEKFERMDSVVLYRKLEELKIELLEEIKEEFIDDGFEEEDVKKYLQEKIIDNL